MRFLPSVEMTDRKRSDNACAGHYRCAPFLPSVLSYLHVNNRHRVVAEDIDHLHRELAPSRFAFVKDAFQLQRPVFLQTETLPLVLKDVIPGPEFFPFITQMTLLRSTEGGFEMGRHRNICLQCAHRVSKISLGHSRYFHRLYESPYH